MKFDDLDARMRIFETGHDHRVLPGIWIVVRLDGRGFTRLTRETLSLTAPFDERFRDAMCETTEHLMSCGVSMRFGYTQSDEISLLLERGDDSFGRKERKLNSILAGEASAFFARRMQTHAAFDSRVCQLPRIQDVFDYFRWRAEDAYRNSLNAHGYWMLRAEGATASDATSRISGLSVSAKHELLFARGTNFNDLPAWQRRGIGFRWSEIEHEGKNPLTGQTVRVTRRRLTREMELPMGDAYSEFLATVIAPEKGDTA